MSKPITGTEPMGYVTRDADGGFHTMDLNGNEGPVCKIIEDGRTIVLTANEANNHYAAVKKVNAYLDAAGSDGLYPLYPRETTTIDTTKVPIPTWIKYLDDTDQKTLNDILTRANEAKLAAKAAPKDDISVLKDKLVKAQQKLNKLIADAKAEGIEIEED